jgi:hypothetical protein
MLMHLATEAGVPLPAITDNVEWLRCFGDFPLKDIGRFGEPIAH